MAIEILKRENAKREKYLKQQSDAKRKTEMHARNISVAPLCDAHPRYKAVRPPSANCAVCRAVYGIVNA